MTKEGNAKATGISKWMHYLKNCEGDELLKLQGELMPQPALVEVGQRTVPLGELGLFCPLRLQILQGCHRATIQSIQIGRERLSLASTPMCVDCETENLIREKGLLFMHTDVW
jgi:hypothetical protein